MKRLLLILVVLILLAAPATAQTVTPPTPIPIPADEMFQGLATADANLLAAPPDIAAPAGVPILPNPNNTLVFGYVKWLISASVSGELFGSFSPVVIVFGVYVSMNMALSVVYGLIYAAVYIARWVIWLFKIIIEIVQVIASALQSLIGWIFKFL